MQPGEQITVTAMRADGTPYRWCAATVLSVTPDEVVVYTPPGTWMHEPGGKGWPFKLGGYSYYWKDRPYNLSECYTEAGEFALLYIHIASPPGISAGEIRYHDYELDVIRRPGEQPQVLDEDEFAAAIVTYGYTPAFQESCREAVAEALDLIERWHPRKSG